MSRQKAFLDSALPTSALLTVAAFAALLGIIYFDAGNLRWNTRLFQSGHEWLSGILLLLALLTFLHRCRAPEWDVFSPVRLYYSIWFALLGLGCLRLTTIEPPLTFRFWVTVACGWSGFLLGALWVRRRPPKGRRIIIERLRRHWKVNWQPSRALLVAGCLFVVCLTAYLYSYSHAGMLPLFAENPNSARFDFGVNSYVQRFALSFYLLIFLSYVGVVHLRKLRFAFGVMGVVSFAAITLLTARVLLLSAIWMIAILFHYGQRRLTPKVAILAILIAYPLAKLAVDVKRFYQDPTFNRVLDKVDFPERLRVFGPDYMYFTLTLQTLDNLTQIVPRELSYAHGWYIGYPVRVFWTPRQGAGFRGRLDDLFWERSSDWSPVPTVTATYLGWPYADFGIPGVFVFSLVFGWISARVYESMRRGPTFWRIFLYSQLSFAIALSIYTSYLSLFDLYWNVIVVGLFDRLVSKEEPFPERAIGSPAVEF